MKYPLLLLPVLFFQYCRSQPVDKLTSNDNGNTLLWEISGNQLSKPSYLFGTFHLMCKEDIKLSGNLKQAIKNSGEVYFEMDLDDPSNMLGGLFFMNMNDGKKLKDLYTPEEYSRIEHFFKDSLKTGMMMVEKMKPNFLEAFLYPKMMPCKTMSGIEQEVLVVAKNDKKEIKGFETIAFQASVFDSIPYEEQAKALLEMIDSIHSYTAYFDTMLHVYKSQQLDEMEKMFSDTAFGMKGEDQDILLDRRNRNWVQQLKKILPETNVFLAVGAGHLVGKNGLIALLKKEGYTLRPLLNK
jgi:uncharacterized protein